MKLTANSEKVDKNQLILTFSSHDFVNVTHVIYSNLTVQNYMIDIAFMLIT